MSNEGRTQQEQSSASGVTLTPSVARLNELKTDEQYCLLDHEHFREDRLEPLCRDILQVGLRVPPTVVMDEPGRPVLIDSHLHVACLRRLAATNTPGYAPDMEIPVRVADGATQQDRLVLSVLDEAVRKRLDRCGRIRAAKALFAAGVPDSRAAVALGVSIQTYEQYLFVARNAWMFQHLLDRSIGPDHATALLEEAVRCDRVRELREDLDGWIAGQKQRIRAEEKLLRARTGRDLPPTRREVRRLMPDHLVRHWLGLMRRGERLNDDARWVVPAAIDHKGVLRADSLNVDLQEAPLEHLALLASKFSQLSKHLALAVEKRRLQDSYEDRLRSVASPYDFALLSRLGFEECAKKLEERLGSYDPFEEVPPEFKAVECEVVDADVGGRPSTRAEPGTAPPADEADET